MYMFIFITLQMHLIYFQYVLPTMYLQDEGKNKRKNLIIVKTYYYLHLIKMHKLNICTCNGKHIKLAPLRTKILKLACKRSRS